MSVLLTAVFCCGSYVGAYVASGGDIQLVNSIVDNGGGASLSGGDYSLKGAIAQTTMPDNVGEVTGGDYVNRTGFYNPPYFTYQKGLPTVFAMVSGDVRLTMPANSVEKETFDITLNKNPLSQPMAVDPEKITRANDKMVYNEGSWSQLFPNNLSELSMFDEQDYYTKPLANKGLLSMRYRDDNNDGILDGSNPPVRIDSLNAWGLDETKNMWVRLQEVGADKSSKMLSVYFGAPGVYALLGAQSEVVGKVYVYPVPFRPNGPRAGLGKGQTGTESGQITFQDVPQTGNIEIYTLDGRLARKISIAENIDEINRRVKWDVKTATGERAASGVYIWRVIAGSDSKTGKLMVIW